MRLTGSAQVKFAGDPYRDRTQLTIQNVRLRIGQGASNRYRFLLMPPNRRPGRVRRILGRPVEIAHAPNACLVIKGLHEIARQSFARQINRQ